MSDWKSSPDIPMAFVFEAGDKGQTKLQERLRKESGHIPPNFLPKKDTPRDDGGIDYGFVPLQAADWLAWELNRAARDFFPEKLESHSQLRWPMQQFLGKPDGKIGIYTFENLKDMDKMIALENEIASWEASIGISTKSRSA